MIEEVVSELHRRGVERGQSEYERRLAEARKEADGIIAAAETRRRILEEESLKHMAVIWAGDEFRDVIVGLLAKEGLPGAARDV